MHIPTLMRNKWDGIYLTNGRIQGVRSFVFNQLFGKIYLITIDFK